MRKLNRKRFGTFSISNYVIEKGMPSRSSPGKTDEQTYYHQALQRIETMPKEERCRKSKITQEFQRDF